MDNLYNYTLAELENLLTSLNQKMWRAKQIFNWLYVKRSDSFETMSDLSNDFRKLLVDNYSLELPVIVRRQTDEDGTIKLLLELSDKQTVETVLMPYSYGNSVCVSTQVGCNMGCSFCASGKLKRQRNLETYEIVAQVLLMQRELDIKSQRLSHIVIMGIGEPLDNYNNVMNFLRIVNNPFGLAIGARHITISTCGLVNKIKQFANENIQCNLAISLHSADDAIREKIMPINKVHNLNELLASIKEYIALTNRRVTFEYILLANINDSEADAISLAKLISGTCSYVNLIPYNSSSLTKYARPSQKKIDKFYQTLKKLGVNVTIRKEFGTNISAACGQLRAKHEEELK